MNPTTPRFHLTDEELAAGLARQAAARSKDKAASSKPKLKRFPKGMKFIPISLAVWDRLLELKGDWLVWAVVRALYQAWFTDPNHHNPVTLTTYSLREFGITRWQKYRALAQLENVKLVTVMQDQTQTNLKVRLEWTLPNI
jgi:hypothetical protein